MGSVIYPSPLYTQFTLPKKSGGVRIIDAPFQELKELQHKLLVFLKTLVDPPKSCVHGFVSGRSIVTNALAHSERSPKFVLNIDLKNFFPTISFYRVRGIFLKRPFSFSHQIASLIAHMCCKDGFLVQGASTSPLISNLICRNLDNQLRGLSLRHNSVYTRYCDDLTFSFPRERAESLPGSICSFAGEIVTLGAMSLEIIASNGFEINSDKTRISSSKRRLEVTGLVINKFPNVSRDYVDRLRGALHAWDVHGYPRALRSWKNKIPYERAGRRPRPPLAGIVRGRLLFLKMVRGADDDLYVRLATKFNILRQRDSIYRKIRALKSLSVDSVAKTATAARKAVYVIEVVWTDAADDMPLVDRRGTVFVTEYDLLISCHHVIDPDFSDDERKEISGKILNRSVKLIVPETNDTYSIDVIKFDSHLDIALLKFSEAKPAGLRKLLFSERSPVQSSGTTLLGFPNWKQGRPLTSASGEITSIYPRSNTNRLEASQAIRQGNSGGPLVDPDFRVIGMAIEGATYDRGNNECLAANEIINWIQPEVDKLKSQLKF